MSTSILNTPASRKRPKPVSPSFKNDGISFSKPHLPRSDVVQQIYDTAKEKQHVVLGSSAATGKTSLIQLIKKKVLQEDGDANVIRINLNSMYKVDDLMVLLKDKGLDFRDTEKLQELKNTWLLLDDAQHCYERIFDPFWQFVVKSIASSDVEENLFVVIAATYDLATPASPADFHGLAHIDPNVTKEEAFGLFMLHATEWGYEGWTKLCDTLVELSRFPESQTFHVGVVMAGMRMLDTMRNPYPQTQTLDEKRALEALRQEDFTRSLDRCFKLPDDILNRSKDRLLDVVVSNEDRANLSGDVLLVPFIRSGLLTKHGQFSNLAARWYYNRRCFPGRAFQAPSSLDDLVTLAVGCLSARRLSDTLVNGFPKEATFQHLFNEAMSQLLPLLNAIIPELNTYASNPTKGSDGTGELDFYVNGQLRWCLELLRNGKKLGEHLGRFDPGTGKYRKIEQLDYIVVDCRGPQKNGKGVDLSEGRCTLYFAEDFKHCVCQMRLKTAVRIELSN